MANQSAAAEPVKRDRRAIKAERTRRLLLNAAREQMAADGHESITIQSITSQADVGLGTFYNYFESRDEVIDTVILTVVETLGQRLDALTANMSDPAEIYAFSLRHLMHTAVTDPVWGWLVVRLGIGQKGLLDALGPRASRDIQLGVDAGRFTVDDVDIVSAMTFGSLMTVMRQYLSNNLEGDPSEQYAMYLLRTVGISPAEAADIVSRPLPDLPELPAD